MKDLTWEHVVEKYDEAIQALKEAITQQTGSNTEMQMSFLMSYLNCANGLKAVVPSLRANSELEKSPPMMSRWSLVWLLGSHLQVNLFYPAEKEKYEVKIVRWNHLVVPTQADVLKQADVSLDEVADTVWEFINEVRTTWPTNAPN